MKPRRSAIETIEITAIVAAVVTAVVAAPAVSVSITSTKKEPNWRTHTVQRRRCRGARGDVDGTVRQRVDKHSVTGMERERLQNGIGR